MSMRDSVNADLTSSREARERAREVVTGSLDQDSPPPLRASDLSAAHTLHPYLHRKPLYNFLLPQPLGLTLLLAFAPLVKVVGAGTGAAPEGSQVVDVEGVRVQLPLLDRTLLRSLFRPVLRSVGLDVTTRLMERGAEVYLSNGTDEDRGTWSRDVCYAAEEAGAACRTFSKSGWSRSWTVARHLFAEVQPRLVLIKCAAGLVTDYAELAYLAAVCVLWKLACLLGALFLRRGLHLIHLLTPFFAPFPILCTLADEGDLQSSSSRSSPP